MKKTLVLLTVMLALVACNKETIEIENPVSMVETNGIKVNLTISRADDFGATKATVKSYWADNDVVFVFFKGVAAPKYLEMKYDGGTWTSSAKNGLDISDLSGAANKKMTAVYLPYGSTATVAASEGNFIFCDITYSGYFLKAELVDYTIESGVLSGTLSMSAPALSSDSDKLIHFDISGFTSGHNYKLYQDYVKPLTFTSVSADGVISKNEGAMGTAITGYEDGSMMSFSGILDASAVGNAVDYQFSIDDLTSSILYTRDAGTKTLSVSKYIGIGAINNTSVWQANEYVNLGLPSGVRWAKCNVGALTESGYGDYFAWGDVEPYYETGYAQENPQTHWKDGKEGYSASTYKWGDGTGNALTKYNTNSYFGNIDDKTILDAEDDVAHCQFGGIWRMPTMEDMDELFNNSTLTWTSIDNINGCLVTSNIEGYTERSIFLPAAGCRTNTNLYNVSKDCLYWSSSLREAYPEYACDISIRWDYGDKALYKAQYQIYRHLGRSVRPVFK